MGQWGKSAKGNVRTLTETCGPYQRAVLGRLEWWQLRKQWEWHEALNMAMKGWTWQRKNR